MNNNYPSGLLLETRTNIRGNFIKLKDNKQVLEPITVPRHRYVILLEYVRDFKEEYVSFLWDNKIIFCIEVDLEHHFKILA